MRQNKGEIQYMLVRRQGLPKLLYRCETCSSENLWNWPANKWQYPSKCRIMKTHSISPLPTWNLLYASELLFVPIMVSAIGYHGNTRLKFYSKTDKQSIFKLLDIISSESSKITKINGWDFFLCAHFTLEKTSYTTRPGWLQSLKFSYLSFLSAMIKNMKQKSLFSVKYE